MCVCVRVKGREIKERVGGEKCHGRLLSRVERLQGMGVV